MTSTLLNSRLTCLSRWLRNLWEHLKPWKWTKIKKSRITIVFSGCLLFDFRKCGRRKRITIQFECFVLRLISTFLCVGRCICGFGCSESHEDRPLVEWLHRPGVDSHHKGPVLCTLWSCCLPKQPSENIDICVGRYAYIYLCFVII